MRDKIARIATATCEFGFLGILFFIPISNAAIEIFFGIAFLGFFVKKVLRPDFKFLKSPIHFFLLLFIISSALSMFNSGPYLGISLKAFFGKWLEYIFMFLVAQEAFSNAKSQTRAKVLILSVAGLVALSALTQKFFGFEFLRQRQMFKIEGNTYALTGPFSHYNGFGTYLVCMLALAIGMLISVNIKARLRLPLLLLAAILGLCLIFTFSRGAWLGFIFAATLILLLSRRIKFLAVLLLGSTILLLLLPQVKERLLFTFRSGGDAYRFLIWQTALSMIKENPFLGKGIGTFMNNFGHFDLSKRIGLQYAHNCYLQIWAETGILCLLSFLAFILLIFVQAFKLNRQKGKDFFLIGLTGALLGFLAHSFFDTQLYSIQLAVLFWVLSGILVARIRLIVKQEGRE